VYEARDKMAAEWLRKFPREGDSITRTFRRAAAEPRFQTGKPDEGDALFGSWLDVGPAWGFGWIGWADCYTPSPKRGTGIDDRPRAEEILRRGYAVPGVEAAGHIAEGLADQGHGVRHSGQAGRRWPVSRIRTVRPGRTRRG
jgi:hypothetical protein